jgi:hypothetical protein
MTTAPEKKPVHATGFFISGEMYFNPVWSHEVTAVKRPRVATMIQPQRFVGLARPRLGGDTRR